MLEETTPHPIHVLNIIAWLNHREGNAPIFEVTALFAALEFSQEATVEVLDALESKNMIQRDGRTHRGKHYAITSRGRELCNLHREHLAEHSDT